VLRIGPAEPLALPDGTPVGHTSLSRDGRTLAIALPDAAVVFDLRSGAEKARFAGQPGLSGALLSPDARWLACCSWNGSGLKVFDLATGKAVFSPPDSDKMGAHFSPDGRWLLTAIGPEFQLWSVGSFSPELRIARQGTGDLLGPVAFAPDGRFLAALVTLKLVRLIDFPSGCELATLEAPDVQHSIASLSFTPDGASLIAANRTRMVHVWDLRLIRQRLAAMKLDWDLPRDAPAVESAAPPLRVEVVK
jgi:WD40 repeat protein